MRKWVFEDYTEDAETSIFFVVPDDYHGTIAETWNEDHARIIAAAPDMLEALEAVMEEKAPRYHDCTDDGLPKCAWCLAEEAISKAKGGSK